MKAFAALLGILFIAAPAMAQSPTPVHADTAIKPSHLAAAVELLELSNTERGIRDGVHNILDAQAQQNPLLAPYRPVMETFAQKYLVWSDLAPQLARIYAQALTEDQIRAAIAFQRTPAGQAFTARQADIQRAIMQLVQAQLTAHAGELQQMIEARAAELNNPAAKKP